MRSLLRSDTALGFGVSLFLAAGACFVAGAIDRHAEQHGHCPPFACFGVKCAQRDKLDAGGEGQGSGHACIVHASPASKNVRGGRQ